MTITISPGAIAGLVLIVLVIAVVRNVWDVGTDDSDQSGRNRSGVSVSTDHKTGLQYLLTPGGGITPRLNIDGRHMRESLPTEIPDAH
jgi:hypothetical protein